MTEGPARWRWWGPLLVVAVVGGAVGVSQLRTDTDHNPQHLTSTRAGPNPLPAVVKSPDPSPFTIAAPAHAAGLTGLKLRDLTFVSADQGWALGTANCLSGSGQTCTALAYSADGVNWAGRGSAPFNLPNVNDCVDPCVTSIRFATEDTGYAFGPSALYLTTNAAASWQRLPGGAVALETLNNNVIRVSAEPTGCSAPGCTYTVQTAPIGGTQWRASSLTNVGAPSTRAIVSLSRTSRVAVLSVLGQPAGYAPLADSASYTSTDDGTTWTPRGEPCHDRRGGVTAATSSAAAAPDSSITLLCSVRSDQVAAFTITSTDSGRSWDVGRGTLAAGPLDGITAASATNLAAVDSGEILYSTDSGASWQHFLGLAGWPSFVMVGFQNASTGRILQLANVEAPVCTIWTTHDGAVTWAASPLY